MKKKKQKYKLINPIVYFFFIIILKIITRIFGQRIKSKFKIEKPTIILSNHSTWFDFAFTLCALYPQRVASVAAEKMFYDPVLGFFLKLSRSIKKKLFDSDINATRSILKHLSLGHSVVVFPEGQISFSGHSLDIGDSIIKLIKKAKVDVAIVKHEGACLVNPYWAKKRFKGTFETKAYKLLDATEVQYLSEENLYNKIKEALYFDPYEYNKEYHREYKIKSIQGIENVLYLCEHCEHIGLTSKKLSLVCPHCGHTLTINKYGFFDDRSVYHLVVKEYEFESQKLLEDENYSLVSQVSLQTYVKNRVKDIDKGALSLSKDGYIFKSDSRELHIDIDKVSAIPSDLGTNIQIYSNGVFYQFIFSENYMPMRFIILGEILYKQVSDKLHGTLIM